MYFFGILRYLILTRCAAFRLQIVIMTVLCHFTGVYHLKECPSPNSALLFKLFYLFYLARGIIREVHL